MPAKAHGALGWGPSWRKVIVVRENGGTWQFLIRTEPKAKTVDISRSVWVDDPDSPWMRRTESWDTPLDVREALDVWKRRAMTSLAHHAVTGEYLLACPEVIEEPA